MWTFNSRGGREVTLIPEATAIIQDLYNKNWKYELPKPVRLFYVSRCYRYERPQAGRYREFTQFGVEILGPKPEEYEIESKKILRGLLDMSNIDYEFDDEVVRGLSYYTRNGFEARAENLGAQKQVAGGGIYAEGCGFAIGVDRVLLSSYK